MAAGGALVLAVSSGLRRPVAPPDLVWVEPGFALGSKPYAHQRDAVVALGVRSVISLHPPEPIEAVAWQAREVQFFALPVVDWVAIPDERFDRAVDLLTARRATGDAVLLHCLAGQNRAPTVAAAVLCRVHGLSVDAALAAIRRARRTAAPTDEQADSLRRWVALRRRRGSR